MRTDPRAAAMSEDRGPDSLEANLLRLLDKYGLWAHHEPNSSRSIGKGWVDWTILSPTGHGAIFAELKSEHGVLSSDQKRVKYMLQSNSLRYVEWRPSDFYAGRIEQALAGLAGVQGELWEESA